MEFSTLQTTLPSSDLEHAMRTRKIAERLDDLRAHGQVADAAEVEYEQAVLDGGDLRVDGDTE